jgi:hypothetical protein
MEGYVPLVTEPTGASAATQQHAIEELLELSDEALAETIKPSCEVVIDGAMSEWGSKVEALFRKIEKSVMLWHDSATNQRIVVVFAEETPQ